MALGESTVHIFTAQLEGRMLIDFKVAFEYAAIRI